ncbi:TPA: LysR family transcriptional regulator [Enterobacter hormaechei]
MRNSKVLMITQINLKSLKAIHILTTCRSVTRTAELMDVSPATISYLLNKVRKATGSALFCRTKNGMIPDSTALELSQRYTSIIGELPNNDDGQPLGSRTLTISTYALIELMLSYQLKNSTLSPKTLRFIPPEMDDEARLIRLRNKEVDMDIGSRLPPDRSIIQVDFISCDIAIIASKNHPTIKDTFTMKDWYENKHIVWSRGMNLVCSNIEHANRFNELVNLRDISVTSSNSLNMITLCCFSNDIVLMPRDIVSFIETCFPVKAFDPPEELRMRFDCSLHYHHSVANDKSMVDLLSMIKELN